MGRTRSEPPVREEFCEWHTSEVIDSERIFTELSDPDVMELLAAPPGRSHPFGETSSQAAGEAICGHLGRRLQALRDDVLFGRGFGLARRIPVDRLNDDEISRAILTLGAAMGTVQQIFACSEALPNAGADVTGILWRRAGASETTLTLVGAVAIHNELARRRPDLLNALYRPNLSGRAAFAVHGRAVSAQGLCDLAKLERWAADAEQSEAYAHAVQLVRQSRLEIDLEPGDVVFVNTHHVIPLLSSSREETFMGWPVPRARGEALAVEIRASHLATIRKAPDEEQAPRGERAAA